MKSVSKDAHTFVEGVVNHLKNSGKARQVMPKVESLLFKMTAGAKREHSAKVVSAVKLTNAELNGIAKTLSKVAGHEVNVESSVEPSLIGGFRIVMADWVMDSSIKNELKEMARIVI